MIKLKRLRKCIKTLSKAVEEFSKNCPSAIEGDGLSAVIEAKRNLIAMIKVFHGDEEWHRAQDL